MSNSIMQEKIKLKIEEVEKKSSCEFVAMVAQKSDDYIYIPIMYAALFALVYPIVHFTFFPDISSQYMYHTQLLLFAVVLIVVQNSYLKSLLIPRAVKHKRASHYAHEQFITRGLHKTSNKQAVLFFVSMKEKYVEIIVDSGVSEKIDNDFLEDVVDQFTQKVKKGDLEEGYLEAIDRCANKLIETFPAIKEKTNTLPDDLIVV